MGSGVNQTKPNQSKPNLAGRKAARDPKELEKIQGLGSELRKSTAEVGTHHDNQAESGERATGGRCRERFVEVYEHPATEKMALQHGEPGGFAAADTPGCPSGGEGIMHSFQLGRRRTSPCAGGSSSIVRKGKAIGSGGQITISWW